MAHPISIIDMGTNSILLLIAEKQGSDWNILHRDAKTSSLGKDMKNGLLAEEGIKRAKQILANYIKKSKKYNCNKIVITGTSAAREAKNIARISNWLTKNYGIKLNTLSENEEINYIYLANRYEFPQFENLLIFDIGGGSTEFIITKDRNIIAQKSLKIGVRRLNNLFMDASDKRWHIEKVLKNSHLLDRINFSFEAIGVGGTVTNLVAVKKNLQTYIPEKVHKQILYKSDIEYFTKLWSSISDEEAKRMIPFDPLRSDVLLSGSLLLEGILNYFSIKKIYASDRGLQFGVLYNNSSWDL
jgi:exopolyphosphatase/guanosine-5'-triphosphate,3'-diphosphate pyrophosphatase